MSWLRFTLSSKGRLEAEKLAMDTRTFFHGSPEDLETLELRVPPNHTAKGVPGEAAVYAAESPIAAALYALARNSSKGSWGVSKDNRLIMKSTKELNPFGYVYELESSDYTSPPEDNLALGFAVKDPKIKSKKRVSAAELQEYIDRVETTEELLKQMGLSKTSSDISVLTAVPKQNLDLILRKGLYSQKAMLNDPEVLAAFIAQRNADKAWKNDEQYDEKRFREEYDKRIELMKGNDAPLAGPSVFFTEPDPDKVSDPRHFVNKFDTQKLRVNLGKLLADIPETRITGAELIPSSAAENMSDQEFEQYIKDRRRDITPEEAAKYIATDPKELWKHYKDEYIGKYYAADVPHAFIRTPSGIIPPEYLEQVEKTSSAKEQLKHILITGQSGSGKTTEAKRLAAELGMPVVHLDEQKGFGPKGLDPDYIEDLTKATQDIISNLDKPHIVEGTQMLSEQFPLELLRSNDLRILEADEDELVKRLTERGWNTESGRDLKGPESAEEARHVAKHQRKSVDSLVERLKKKAALEDEFQPDLSPDDLKALGVYDQVYGDAPREASMKEWPAHWINPQDPLGWLQWYERYSGGRRTEDDERQIKRWNSFKARHLAQYLKNPTPRRAAALRNWGIDVEKHK